MLTIYIFFVPLFRKCTSICFYNRTLASRSDWEYYAFFYNLLQYSVSSGLFFFFAFHIFCIKGFCLIDFGFYKWVTRIFDLIMMNGKTVNSLILTGIFLHNHFFFIKNCLRTIRMHHEQLVYT